MKLMSFKIYEVKTGLKRKTDNSTVLEILSIFSQRLIKYRPKKISKGRRSEENPLPTTYKRKPHIKERSAIGLGTFFSAFCNFPDVLNYGLGLSSDIQHIYHISSSNLWLQMFSICLLKIYFILHHLLSIHFTLSSWSVILRFTFLTKYLFHTLLFFVLL